MTLGLDKKEDLRLRMQELEAKLAESEEERCKLEKSCNILIRAFREEEKMHYKELNKKYEKFLEDCTLRRRRNDIILKSLCRIEDRARALSAKTERLKILKDRYISYLKITHLRKEEPVLKSFPYSFTSQNSVRDVIPKSVHWKSPNISDVILDHTEREFIEPERSSFYKFDLTKEGLNRENNREFFETGVLDYKNQEKDISKYENLWQKDSNSAFDNKENTGNAFEKYKQQKEQTYLENLSLNRENKFYNINNTQIAQSANPIQDFIADRDVAYERVSKNEPEIKNTDEVVARINKLSLTHQESIERLKKTLSEDDETENDKFENCRKNQNIIEKDEIETNEKTLLKRSDLKSDIENLNQFAKSETDKDTYNEYKNDVTNVQSDEVDEDVDDTVPVNVPAGLDGVDYQNETYPESYYEQPVHHNHTSIASDVILEEDELEQDVDQNESDKGAKNPLTRTLANGHESYFVKNNSQEAGQPNEPYREKQSIESPDKTYSSCNEERSFENLGEQHKTDGFDRDEQSKKSDSRRNSDRNDKRPTQTNLMQLLESDSESFQIEHGDLATGNEDSDFDFSFNQN